MEDNFDEYEFKDVTRDTFYAIVDVSRNIKRFVEDSHTIDLNCNPVDGQREHKELNNVVTSNIVDAIKDRLYRIDTENKVIQGVDVAAVRCVIGRADFDNFFGQSRIFKDTLTAEDAVQLMDPLDSVIYCKKHGFEYPKEKTDGFDLSKKARDRIAGKKVVPCKRKSLDLSQFYGENKYSDGTDIEL